MSEDKQSLKKLSLQDFSTSQINLPVEEFLEVTFFDVDINGVITIFGPKSNGSFSYGQLIDGKYKESKVLDSQIINLIKIN